MIAAVMEPDYDAIIRENGGLVELCVGRLTPAAKQAGVDLDDLRQIGRIAMWRAARKFDPDRGKFSTFAVLVIRQTMSKHIYRSRRDYNRLPTVSTECFQAFQEPELPPDVDRERLARALQWIPKQFRTLLTRYFGLNGRRKRSMKELSIIEGVSQQAISLRVQRALYLLRKRVPDINDLI